MSEVPSDGDGSVAGLWVRYGPVSVRYLYRGYVPSDGESLMCVSRSGHRPRRRCGSEILLQGKFWWVWV